MKHFLILLSLFVWVFVPADAQNLSKSVAFLIKGAPADLPKVSTEVTRQIFRQARVNFKAPASLLPRMQRSIVQISLPRYTEGVLQENLPTYASGFLLSAYGRTWVASAYHVMGEAGHTRVVRFRGRDGQEKEVVVKVEVNGTSGWHEPDLSLAPIKPEDIPEGMEPLELGEPDLNAPAYSVGYTTGNYSMNDFLPVQREFTNAEGINLYGPYHINGSTWENPVTGNGQCGSPIVQRIPGTQQWQVVGLHNGHLLDLDNPHLSRGSGVNLSVAVPYLLDAHYNPSVKVPARRLYVRGFQVTSLQDNERVSEITLKRNGQEVWTKNIQKFPHPYSDAHAELAFEDDEVFRGDELVFKIVRRQQIKPNRYIYTKTFIMP